MGAAYLWFTSARYQLAGGTGSNINWEGFWRQWWWPHFSYDRYPGKCLDGLRTKSATYSPCPLSSNTNQKRYGFSQFARCIIGWEIILRSIPCRVLCSTQSWEYRDSITVLLIHFVKNRGLNRRCLCLLLRCKFAVNISWIDSYRSCWDVYWRQCELRSSWLNKLSRC